MQFDHEKLDVYRASLQFAAWAYSLCKDLDCLDRAARDQLLRASQSIPLNIAEGNGKRPGPDRKRFLQIAYGSALECAAILDVLVACESVSEDRTAPGKQLLHRVVAMLIRMTASADQVREEGADYGAAGDRGEHEFESESECRCAESECDVDSRVMSQDLVNQERGAP